MSGDCPASAILRNTENKFPQSGSEREKEREREKQIEGEREEEKQIDPKLAKER